MAHLRKDHLSTLVPLTHTCRALSEPALDLIWAEAPLYHLACTISESAWTRTYCRCSVEDVINEANEGSHGEKEDLWTIVRKSMLAVCSLMTDSLEHSRRSCPFPERPRCPIQVLRKTRARLGPPGRLHIPHIRADGPSRPRCLRAAALVLDADARAGLRAHQRRVPRREVSVLRRCGRLPFCVRPPRRRGHLASESDARIGADAICTGGECLAHLDTRAPEAHCVDGGKVLAGGVVQSSALSHASALRAQCRVSCGSHIAVAYAAGWLPPGVTITLGCCRRSK
jgi:hypothetical protein